LELLKTTDPKRRGDFMIENIDDLENSKNYFMHGTFDLADMIAIFIGATMAYLFLAKTMERGAYGKE
jgi:hypothetical protein